MIVKVFKVHFIVYVVNIFDTDIERRIKYNSHSSYLILLSYLSSIGMILHSLISHNFNGISVSSFTKIQSFLHSSIFLYDIASLFYEK